MYKTILRATVAVAALSASALHAADTLSYGPAPAWVKPVATPTAPVTAPGPIAARLENLQAHLDADGETYYTEIAIQVQNAQGLNAAQALIAWNPTSDTVTIDTARILRGDQVIDLLAKGQTFTVLRRESGLERAVLDGTLTAVLQPEGLQVGDILSFSFTETRRDQIFAGMPEAWVHNDLPMKVSRLVMRGVWADRTDVKWQASDDIAAQVKVSKTADGSEVLFDGSDVERPKVIDNAPDRYNRSGTLTLSGIASWSEISRRVAPLYEQAATLAVDSPLHAEIDKIRAASPDPKVQAAAALHLVENNVRYLYLSLNQSGFAPAAADLTWSRRFGDCKGKSALLLALLTGLGIHAEAVHVTTRHGDGLDQRLPMIETFDHVMVRADVAGKVYWLDATRYGDGDLDSLPVPDYRWALPIRTSGAALEAMIVPPATLPLSDHLIVYDATGGIDSKVPVHGEMIMRGDTALGFSLAAQNMSADDLDKAQRSLWNAYYDGLDITTQTTTFDPATGEEKMVMDGTAHLSWSVPAYQQGRRYEASADLAVYQDTDRDAGPHHDVPLAVDFPSFDRVRETIKLPDKGRGFTVIGEQVDVTLAGRALKRVAKIDPDGVFTIDTSTQTLQSEVPYADAAKAQDELDRLATTKVYVEAPRDYKPTEGDTSNLSVTAPDGKDDYVIQGNQLMRRGQYKDAIADYDAALKAKPDDFEALTRRAVAKQISNDLAGALDDIAAAIKLNPGSAQLWSMRGGVLGAQQKYAEAVDAFSHALELQSTFELARASRIYAYMSMGNDAKATEEAELFIILFPDSSMAHSTLSAVYAKVKRHDDAVKEMRKAVELAPDNAELHTGLGDLLNDCSHLDAKACVATRAEAVEQYDKAIAIAPSAYAFTARSQARPGDAFELKRQDIDLSLQLQPDSWFAMTSRASLDLSLKDYDTAINDADKALAMNPKEEQAYEIRAFANEGKKQYDLAIIDWSKAIALAPTNANYRNSACWLLATRTTRYDEALAHCNAGLQIDPKSSHLLDSRAFVYLRLKNYPAALADYDAALALQPALGASLFGRGLVKQAMGDTRGAKADYAAARALYKGVDAYYADFGLKP